MYQNRGRYRWFNSDNIPEPLPEQLEMTEYYKSDVVRVKKRPIKWKPELTTVDEEFWPVLGDIVYYDEEDKELVKGGTKLLTPVFNGPDAVDQVDEVAMFPKQMLNAINKNHPEALSEALNEGLGLTPAEYDSVSAWLTRNEYVEELPQAMRKIPSVDVAWFYHGRSYDARIVDMLENRKPGIVSGSGTGYTVAGIQGSFFSTLASKLTRAIDLIYPQENWVVDTMPGTLALDRAQAGTSQIIYAIHSESARIVGPVVGLDSKEALITGSEAGKFELVGQQDVKFEGVSESGKPPRNHYGPWTIYYFAETGYEPVANEGEIMDAIDAAFTKHGIQDT